MKPDTDTHDNQTGAGPSGTEDRPDVPRVSGTVVRITFHNPENGYTVARLEPDGSVAPADRQPDGLVTLVGAMPGLEAGQPIVAEGQWVRDPKFGRQFRVTWFKPTLPSGLRGIKAYLQSGSVKGIGPVMAGRIVARFGEKTFEVLDAHPERLREVPGIGTRTLKKIIAAWRSASGDRELITFLGEHGIAPGVAARMRKVYGDRALSIVRANPYQLTGEVRGIGFARADEIARKIGLAEDAPERIDAALAHVLERQSGEGHTCLPRSLLESMTVELLGIEAGRVEERLDIALAARKLTAEQLGEEPAVFLPLLHDAELRLAHRLRRLASIPRRLPAVDPIAALADFEQRARIRLAPAQREAVLTFAREGLMILTGGPGTGKTTSVRAIIELFTIARRQIKLAAPTGRAARRLAETARLQADTIHRLLSFQPHLGQFARDATNPIEADLVIVDETSMLDVPLAANLMEAIAGGTCLLLIGDEDQLPSVGPGNVLGDLIAAGVVPVVRLTEVFRQAGESLIVTNAHRINRGQMPFFEPPAEAAGREPDFYFIEREDPQAVLETIGMLVAERIPRKFGMDPLRDIQVLTPMRRGELGVENINHVLKARLNPDASGRAAHIFTEGDDEEASIDGSRGRVFSRGDRVMQTANNYDKNVFNGDIGHIESIDPGTREVIVSFDGRLVSYLADEVDQLVLAYATTIHKSQGSEYPAVIVPVHTQHWIMLQRNLIYTALTRARRLVCMVGTRRAVRRAVGNARQAQRYTALKEFLARGGEEKKNQPQINTDEK